MKKTFIILLTAALCSLTGFARKPHIVWIGIDGWASYCFEPGVNCNMPNLRGLMDNGSWSIHVRPVLPSDSGPNWCSMFCGAPESMHGFTGNADHTEATPVEINEHGMFPTIFHVLRKARPNAEIGVQHEWETINVHVDSVDLNHMVRVDDPTQTVPLACKYIKEKKPDLFFIHIDQCDHAGHTKGHRTPEYYKTVSDVDRQVGEIIQSTKDAGIYDNTVFVVTSDHGGIKTGHGESSDDELNVPVIYSGKGVPRDKEMKQVIVQFDAAPTIAHILGIKTPDCWRGKSSLK